MYVYIYNLLLYFLPWHRIYFLWLYPDIFGDRVSPTPEIAVFWVSSSTAEYSCPRGYSVSLGIRGEPITTPWTTAALYRIEGFKGSPMIRHTWCWETPVSEFVCSEGRGGSAVIYAWNICRDIQSEFIQRSPASRMIFFLLNCISYKAVNCIFNRAPSFRPTPFRPRRCRPIHFVQSY